MKPWAARLITYGIVGALAAAALAFIRPLPPRPTARDEGSETPSSVRETVDSVGRGETLSKVLERGGLYGGTMLAALNAAPSLDPRRVRAGMRVTFSIGAADSLPRQITFHRDIDLLLHIIRTDSGWMAREDTLPWLVDTTVVRGNITTNLYEALDRSAIDFTTTARPELAWGVADIFEFRVDMSRDLQVGDSFAVLVERREGPDGLVRVGRVLAASLTNGGATIQAFRHEKEGERPRYYDQDGKSLAANFLRAPLTFRRISSVFGLRKHPILGVWRRHQGTDYAANSGTPVRSIGEGVVVFAGWRGGYGNVIDVRHANGFVSRYGHLRGMAKGVRGGRRVTMGETIGYVGMTGLATAPHLHFEILVGGVHRNPRTALVSKSGAPLPESERVQFQSVKAQYLSLLSAGTRATATN